MGQGGSGKETCISRFRMKTPLLGELQSDRAISIKRIFCSFFVGRFTYSAWS